MNGGISYKRRQERASAVEMKVVLAGVGPTQVHI